MRVSAAALPRFPPPGPGPRGPSSAPGYSPASPPCSPLPARLGPPGRGVPSLRCHGGAPSMPCSALPSPFLPSPLPAAWGGPAASVSPLHPPFPSGSASPAAAAGPGRAEELPGAAPGQPGLGWVPLNRRQQQQQRRLGVLLPAPRCARPRCAVQVLFGHPFSRSCEGSGAWRSLARLGEVGKLLLLLPGVWLRGWSLAPSRSFLLPSVTGRVGGVVQQVFPPLPLQSGAFGARNSL